MASNISSRAMLVNLTIRQWSARKHDKRVSQEVADNHGNDVALGRFNKSLVERDALKPITTAVTVLREYHYKNTLPWLDTGARILPAANYLAYTGEIRKLRAGFEEAVADFLGRYDRYVDEAERRLGTLYRPDEYPSRHDIADRFAIDVGFLPLPEANDFRVELGDLEERRIKAEIEERMAAAVEQAHRSLWQRVHEAVAHMVERLNAYQKDADGKVMATFRDSLVGNVRELVELLPRLNLTNDPELERMRQRIARELAVEEAETLRDNATVRASVARAAEDILSQMAGYIGDDVPAAAE